jgi:small subunit ribosomal protein S3
LGHKVHPVGFRLGVIKGWQSRWFAEKTYKDLLAEDLRLRQMVRKELASAGVSKVEIERPAARQITVTIHTAKPGIVIGKSGQKVEDLRQHLEHETGKKVRLNILEIRQPELDALLVAKSIAEQLEKRISFRRAMKQAVQKAVRSGAKGIKVIVGGRLGGAEIARTEKEVEGKVPLQTLRADIDYDYAEAHTTYGVIGIKVWIYRGDVLPDKRRMDVSAAPELAPVTPGAPGGREERRERGPRGPRGERGPRGDRGGFAGPRGERGPRGEGAPRGERGGFAGPRGPRGEGAPAGERPPRPAGEGGPRPPRPAGERGPRAPRTDRPPRPAGDTAGPQEQAEQAPPSVPADTSDRSAPAEQSTPRPEEQSES